MADRKAIVIEPNLTDQIILCKSYLGSKIKYRRLALVIGIDSVKEKQEDVFKILVNSQWKDVTETKIVIGGEWKNVISSSIIVDGEWKN